MQSANALSPIEATENKADVGTKQGNRLATLSNFTESELYIALEQKIKPEARVQMF